MENITVISCEPTDGGGYDILLSNGTVQHVNDEVPAGALWKEGGEHYVSPQVTQINTDPETNKTINQPETPAPITTPVLGEVPRPNSQIGTLTSPEATKLDVVALQEKLAEAERQIADFNQNAEDHAMVVRGLSEANETIARLNDENLALKTRNAELSRLVQDTGATVTGVAHPTNVDDLPPLEALPVHPELKS